MEELDPSDFLLDDFIGLDVDEVQMPAFGFDEWDDDLGVFLSNFLMIGVPEVIAVLGVFALITKLFEFIGVSQITEEVDEEEDVETGVVVLVGIVLVTVVGVAVLVGIGDGVCEGACCSGRSTFGIEDNSCTGGGGGGETLFMVVFVL